MADDATSLRKAFGLEHIYNGSILLKANLEKTFLFAPCNISKKIFENLWCFPGEVDLVVIGSGPGGYVASIKAAQLGMKVTGKSFTGCENRE